MKKMYSKRNRFNLLNLTIATVVTLLYSGYHAHGASPVLQSLASEPSSDVVIQQSTSTPTGITARYTSSGDFRSVTQTFTLASDTLISGIGVLIAVNQNSVGGTAFAAEQEYSLDIQQVNPSTGAVTETIVTYTFRITPGLVAAGKWLYISFNLPASHSKLSGGSTYGFNLRPTEIIPNNNLVVARSGADIYNGGFANQNGAEGVILGQYGKSSSVGDLTFFITELSKKLKKE